MLQPKHHLFIIDPLDSLILARDTTIKLAFALEKQGVDVFFAEISGLSRSLHPKSIHAHARRARFAEGPASISMDSPSIVSLTDFAVIYMRKEPPYDLDYIAALWLLQSVIDQVTVLNTPHALQRLNEKLAILDFPEFTRPALVSSNPSELISFAQNHCNGNIVVKPLHLFGGRGVVHLNNPQTLAIDLIRETEQGTKMRLIQPFEPKIAQGEVRVFLAGGVAISWCLKIPTNGNFLANTRAGSVLYEYSPTPREKEIAQKVGSSLLRQGVYFAGLDLIDGWLSEVNITCPALLAPDRESIKGFDVLARQILDGPLL